MTWESRSKTVVRCHVLQLISELLSCVCRQMSGVTVLFRNATVVRPKLADLRISASVSQSSAHHPPTFPLAFFGGATSVSAMLLARAWSCKFRLMSPSRYSTRKLTKQVVSLLQTRYPLVSMRESNRLCRTGQVSCELTFVK